MGRTAPGLRLRKARVYDSHARWGEAAYGHPGSQGCEGLADTAGAHALQCRRLHLGQAEDARCGAVGAARVGRRRVHPGRPGYSRQVRLGGRLRDDATADRAAESDENRRHDRCLGHDRLAREERARVEWARRYDRLVVRRVDSDDGTAWTAPGTEGGGAGEPDDRRLDGGRLVPLRRVPADEPGLFHSAVYPAGRWQHRAAARRGRLSELSACGNGGPLGRGEWPKAVAVVESAIGASGLRRLLAVTGAGQTGCGEAREYSDAVAAGIVGPGGYVRCGARVGS